MFTYHAYGLTIGSDFELSGLQPGTGRPDVRILERALEHDAAETWAGDGQQIYGSYFDKATVLIANGDEIALDIKEEISEGDFNGLILGELMATLLRQRGLLVIHACAVADPQGNAISFAGESGWGKSTLAEHFCQHGYTLITDDVIAIDIRDDGAYAVPSYAQIRLRTDAASYLVDDTSLLIPIERNGSKQAREDHALAEKPLPLRALFLLDPTFEDEFAVVDLAPQEVLMRLVAHTRAKTLVHTNAPDLLREHLDQCAKLMKTVPVRRLVRRRSLDDLGILRSLVVESVVEGAASEES